jgi:hypothetical protein
MQLVQDDALQPGQAVPDVGQAGGAATRRTIHGEEVSMSTAVSFKAAPRAAARGLGTNPR